MRACQIRQLPLPHRPLRALPDNILHLLLQFARKYLTGHLPPLRLLQLVPHGLHPRVLPVQHLPDFHQLSGKLLLLYPHVILYELVTLSKGRLENLGYFVANSFKFAVQHFGHLTVEILYFVVYIRYLGSNLLRKVIQALQGLKSGGLEAVGMRDQTRPNLILRRALEAPRSVRLAVVLLVVADIRGRVLGSILFGLVQGGRVADVALRVFHKFVVQCMGIVGSCERGRILIISVVVIGEVSVDSFVIVFVGVASRDVLEGGEWVLYLWSIFIGLLLVSIHAFQKLIACRLQRHSVLSLLHSVLISSVTLRKLPVGNFLIRGIGSLVQPLLIFGSSGLIVECLLSIRLGDGFVD